jgi:hypothetical protein
MAALSRFISWLGIRGLPFFKLLKKQDKFYWTQEAQEAFEDLKKYLTTPPMDSQDKRDRKRSQHLE